MFVTIRRSSSQVLLFLQMRKSCQREKLVKVVICRSYEIPCPFNCCYIYKSTTQKERTGKKGSQGVAP